MDNTADKLNELEGPYYDSGTVRALQELETECKFYEIMAYTEFPVKHLHQRTLQVAYYMRPCLLHEALLTT